MRQVIIGFFLLLLPSLAQAQSELAEKLRKTLQKHTQADTFRVNRLVEISLVSPSIPLDEMEEYAEEALKLSRQLKYPFGEAGALLALSRYYSGTGNFKASLEEIHKADSIAMILGDTKLLALVYLRYYNSYYLSGNNKEALIWLKKAESYAIQNADLPNIGTIQNQLSNVYGTLGDYGRALQYASLSMETATDLGDSLKIYLAHNRLANIFLLIGEYDKSLVNLEKMLVFHEKLKFDSARLANVYNDLGEVYRLSNDFPKAISAYNQALKVRKDENITIVVKSNLADVYLRMDSIGLALDYAYAAKTTSKSKAYNYYNGWISGVLARAHLKQGRLDSAEYYAAMGYKIGMETAYMEDMRDNAQTLAAVYAYKNDYKNAYDFFQKYISYRDSMLTDEVKNKSAIMEYNLEMVKKEDEIALLSEQKKTQQNFLISTVVVLGLILIMAFVLLRNNRHKQKANLMLRQQKQEIDEKAKELTIQKDNLEQSYQNMELLAEIGRKVTASLSVNGIIGTVYDQVNKLMDASIFGIGIYHEDRQCLEFPATYEKGEALPAYDNDIHDKNKLAAVCYNTGNEILINDLNSEYGQYLQHMPTVSAGEMPLSLIYLPLKVKDKIVGVITVQSFNKHAFTDYHLFMLRTIAVNTAIALENAESFLKLEHTLTNLKETQNQLIQAEKMASLGELTAGIAHEIQNPLNFVNNFSEVSGELLEEIREEMEAENYRDAALILKDLESNLSKIQHHGTRAASIVKGMLAHSRNSSDEKIPTDINALADEYLRLAYHGMRAKDKSFNSEIFTDLQPGLPKVNVVPQEISRVLLNITTNAFQALKEHYQELGGDFKPYVKIRTSLVPTAAGRGSVEISISDNGPGIPESLKEKIFQPFFTTKPTGQGTGLGLSLSFDIVKAHGGEIKVSSEPGEGTEFTVNLPVAE
jgi:signal transduction histidine kinase